MQFVKLSDKFFEDYSACKEILVKRERPYACVTVIVNGITFGIPMRHHIEHKYAFFTKEKCGLDYTKAVVIRDDNDVGTRNVQINSEEYQAIKGKENKIISGLIKYISLYKKAKEHPENQKYCNILKYSSLKYFEEYL